ncbi:MAG: hypothetical protein WCK96_07105 [Methylococcales bacterium]
MQVEFKEIFAKDLTKINSVTVNKVKGVIEQIELADSLNSIAHVKNPKALQKIIIELESVIIELA